MSLRWTGAAMLEAAKGFRRLKAHRQLPILKAALAAHGARHTIKPVLERADRRRLTSPISGARSPNFNRDRDIPDQIAFRLFRNDS